MVHLAARCSNPEYLGCKVGADEWLRSGDPYQEHFMHGFPGCKCDTRKGFANVLRDVDLPAALKYVQLPRPFDSFSSSLRLLSSQLRRLDLHVMADDTLSWAPADTETPLWPDLEIFPILLHFSSPSGQ